MFPFSLIFHRIAAFAIFITMDGFASGLRSTAESWFFFTFEKIVFA